MFGSEAGLVRISKPILTTSAATADSGPQCLEAKDWRNWTFTVEGTIPGGGSVTWYGTNDPATAGTLPGTATPPFPGDYGGTLAVTPTAANWFKIPAEAIQSGTGTEANPITSNLQSLSYDRPVLAVRAVVAGNTVGNVLTAKVAAVP
jgi:hypothetical protein